MKGLSFFVRNRIPLFVYSITFILFAISTISRILFNGFIYDFDYFLYQPDGIWYTHMALTYSGVPSETAAKQIVDWYALNAKPDLNLQIEIFDKALNPEIWALVSPRIFYPILSLPFLHFFGIPGMLVIPSLSFLVLLLLVARISIRLNNITVGIILIFFLTTSSTISRWYVANLTDGVLATLVAVALYILIWKNRFQTPLLLLTISAASFTRFSLPIWLALVVFLLIKREVKKSMLIGTWAILNFLPVVTARPDYDFVAPAPTQNLLERVFDFILEAFRLLFIEFAQLAAIDRSLLFIILFSILLSFSKWRNESSQLFILIGLAVWLIGAINPVLGVNFRYQLPLLFVSCWTILDKFNLTRHGPLGDILHIVRNEPKK